MIYLAYAPYDKLLRWLAANPGYVVVSTWLGHHSRWSVLCEKRD